MQRNACSLVFTAIAMAASFGNSSAVSAQTWANECDRQAGVWIDTRQPLEYVLIPMEKIDIRPAYTACMNAVRENPDDARMAHQLGRVLEANQSWQDAAIAYQAAIDKGSLFSANNLGLMYETGHPGVVQNRALAYSLLTYAGKQGLKVAKYNAGGMLQRHEITDSDSDRATQYLAIYNAEQDRIASLNAPARVVSAPAPSQPPTQYQPVQSTPSRPGLTDEQKVVTTVAVGAGVLCAIFQDACKELLWQAARGAAREAGAQAVRKYQQ